ncbi:Poly(A) RNA polymerase cid11 [Schizosaccharomyces pombe]
MQQKKRRFDANLVQLQESEHRNDQINETVDAELTNECWKLYMRLKPSNEEVSRRQQFVDKLRTILSTEIKDAKLDLFVFGSTENNLAIQQSDVDVCIITNGSKYLNSTCQLAQLLYSYGMKQIVCVSRARVPIVKIWDPQFDIHCDLNINNDVAKINTKMLRLFVSIDPRVRPLGLIIKYWAKQRALCDAAGSGTITSYTISCMLVNFLQTRNPPILPAMLDLMSNDDNKMFVDDIVGFKEKATLNKTSLGRLLIDFFYYYGFSFNYLDSVVSVRSGTVLNKQEKGWAMEVNNSLCVEEPFNTARNLANTADNPSVKGLQSEFQRAFRLMSENNACERLCKICEEYQFLDITNEANYGNTNTPFNTAYESFGCNHTVLPEAAAYPKPYYPPQITLSDGGNMNFLYYIPDESNHQSYENKANRDSDFQGQTSLIQGSAPPWHYIPCQSWLVWYPSEDASNPASGN